MSKNGTWAFPVFGKDIWDFYNWCAEIETDVFCEQLKSKVKALMIYEKCEQ
jgi:hypothetical protein